MIAGASPKKNRLRPALAAAWLLCALALTPAAVRGEEPAPGAAAIESLWSRGEAAFKAGDLDAALRLFDAALALDQGRARSWNYVGGVHFAQGDLTRALAAFRRALELDPRDVRACNNLGTALERLGDYAGARRAYEQAVLVDPAYPITQRNLGILESRQPGNPDAARRAWERYLELAPGGAYAAEVRRELDALKAAAPAPGSPVPPVPPVPPAPAVPAVPSEPPAR
jgi:tetratricopeptide (TPR) repeat protein